MLTRHLLSLDERLKVVCIIDGDPFHGIRVAISIIDCKTLLSFAANFVLSRPREVRKRLPWGEVGALPICRLAGDKVYTRLKFINLLLVHR